MTTPTGDAVLAQILAGQTETQKGIAQVADRLSNLTAEVREANSGMREQVHNLRADVDDHEGRLRTIEQDDYITRADLEVNAKERNRKQLAWIAIILTAIGIIEAGVVALIVNHGP